MRRVPTTPAAAVARGEPLALLRLGLEHQPGVVTTAAELQTIPSYNLLTC